MSSPKVCLIGQFPPPIHGLSKALDTLYTSDLADRFQFEKIDITDNKRIFKNLRAIKKSNADIFYLTIAQSRLGNLRDILLARAIRKKKKKFIVHLHGGGFRVAFDRYPGFQKRLNKKYMFSHLSNAIVLGKSLSPIFNGLVPENKLRIVPNCVDDAFLPSQKDVFEKIEAEDKKPIHRVLYLSNFIKEKGYPIVLELARQEAERIKDGEAQRFTFDFAGKFFSKKEEKEFFEFIKNNGLESIVNYHGIVGGERKKQLLFSDDIFILPTVYRVEGQPISIIEAMGNGLFIVTTNHAGIPDLVTRDNGLVLPLDCPPSIEALQGVDYTICKDNYLRVLKEFSQKNYLDNLASIFDEAMD